MGGGDVLVTGGDLSVGIFLEGQADGSSERLPGIQLAAPQRRTVVVAGAELAQEAAGALAEVVEAGEQHDDLPGGSLIAVAERLGKSNAGAGSEVAIPEFTGTGGDIKDVGSQRIPGRPTCRA